MGSHSVTCDPVEVWIPPLTPAEAGTQFSDPGGMQGWVQWVDICYVKADRLGFELATCRVFTQSCRYRESNPRPLGRKSPTPNPLKHRVTTPNFFSMRNSTTDLLCRVFLCISRPTIEVRCKFVQCSVNTKVTFPVCETMVLAPGHTSVNRKTDKFILKKCIQLFRTY